MKRMKTALKKGSISKSSSVSSESTSSSNINNSAPAPARAPAPATATATATAPAYVPSLSSSFDPNKTKQTLCTNAETRESSPGARHDLQLECRPAGPGPGAVRQIRHDPRTRRVAVSRRHDCPAYRPSHPHEGPSHLPPLPDVVRPGQGLRQLPARPLQEVPSSPDPEEPRQGRSHSDGESAQCEGEGGACERQGEGSAARPTQARGAAAHPALADGRPGPGAQEAAAEGAALLPQVQYAVRAEVHRVCQLPAYPVHQVSP